MRAVRGLTLGALISLVGCGPSGDPSTDQGDGAAGSGGRAEISSDAHSDSTAGGGGTDPKTGLQPPDAGASSAADGAPPSKTDAEAVINVPPTVAQSKVDLLLMIDNSASMADKQAILATAVPALVERLLDPSCADPDTGKVVSRPVDGACPKGTVREFQSPNDVHVGIIDSSLGGYGVPDVCDDARSRAQGYTDPHQNDAAHLITRGAPQAAVDGFLSWKAGTDWTALKTSFASRVTGVGQQGCGYEAQLESIYRFLIEPDPPAQTQLELSPGSSMTSIVGTGRDTLLLQQRAAFLRPDSLVLVVLFSDEDDCSLQQEGQAWLSIANQSSNGTVLLRPGTTPCRTNPNDPCCFNCGVAAPPAGCPSPDTDPACKKNGEWITMPGEDDPANLRCWHQKQKHGVDFLYPVQRYIDGLSKPKIVNRTGQLVDNPLFADLSCIANNDEPEDVAPRSDAGAGADAGKAGDAGQAADGGRADAGVAAVVDGGSGRPCVPVRAPSSVIFTAVVGVPWQDLARDPRDISKGYKSPAEMANQGVWSVIVGNPNASPPVAPTDPLMVDSVEPRTAETTGNPLGAAALPATVDSQPNANPINGHEWYTASTYPQANSDLQFACIFDLAVPRDCGANPLSCDCLESSSTAGTIGPAMYKSPLCQDATGAYTTMQVRAKAYPGLRELRVVQGLGNQGVAASICPAVLKSDSSDPTYGYNPVVNLVIEHTKPHLPPPPIH